MCHEKAIYSSSGCEGIRGEYYDLVSYYLKLNFASDMIPSKMSFRIFITKHAEVYFQ